MTKPTFGNWADMLTTLLNGLARNDLLVVPEMPELVQQLLVLLKGGNATSVESLLALGNDLVHAGGLPRGATAAHTG